MTISLARLSLLVVAVALGTPLNAAGLPRNFTITSFDRIRVEGPYAVTLAVGRSPGARAEGSAAQIDAIDLRVEGRTLIIRERRASGAQGGGRAVSIAVATPDLRSAMVIGSGSLEIDRLRGLSVEVAAQGPGSLSVKDIAADRVSGALQGSGSLVLVGKAKTATLSARGTPTLNASGFEADQLTLAAEGAGEVVAVARSRATVSAAGTMRITLSGQPTCVLRVSGSASVEGCGKGR